MSTVTVDELKRREQLGDRDVEELIERAARLQERAQAGERGVSLEELRSTAKELDIEPAFLDAALDELRRERSARERAAKEGRARLRRRVRFAAVGLGAALLVALLLAWSGSSRLRAAEERASQSEAGLRTVLDRQAAVLPQLVAMAGGQAPSLDELRLRLEGGATIQERLAASRALGAAMAEQLGRLPPAVDPAGAQQRLSLQHELIGAQNRITVEQRRHEEALAAWREAASGVRGGMAVRLGFRRAPD